MAQVSGDWLADDGQQNRASQKKQALEFAQQYVYLFADNPTGKRLLEHWTRTLGRKRTPVNATIQEYAATEAVRAFIEEIHAQINFARTEG
ncbi:MAG: hypothetical protein ACREXP_00070 [Steroidobacteraceae bacterium]